MARSLVTAARAAGHAPEAVAGLAELHAAAMAPRVAALADDHHPAYLHPGRTALVLLRDVGPCQPETLRLALVLESEDPALAVSDESLASLDEELAARRAGVPAPGAAGLGEWLVTADEGSVLATLAERLDQLRHLHLRPDLRERWEASHDEVERIWLPVAQRTHDKLATRFAHWARTFVRRL